MKPEMRLPLEFHPEKKTAQTAYAKSMALFGIVLQWLDSADASHRVPETLHIRGVEDALLPQNNIV